MKELFYDPSNFVRVSFVIREKLLDRLDRTSTHFNPRSSAAPVARRHDVLRGFVSLIFAIQLTLSRFLPAHISVLKNPAGSSS